MSKIINWARRRKLDLAVIATILVISGLLSAVNMTGNPQRFEDEGTYVSQAWAVMERGELAHYTYWYDHPPLGWIQMAGYFTVTNALDRYGSSITAGREFMLVMHIISVGLLYALARRVGLGVVASAIGALAFALSPLSIDMSRYVLLDNIALPWAIGALFLAANPKRSIGAAVASALCMVIAIMSKETFALLLPTQLYLLIGASDRRNRRYVLTAFVVVFVLSGSLYPLYAALKNELFVGEGHVSLLGTVFWQLLGRTTSGDIFEQGTQANNLISYWVRADWWLMLAGLLAAPIALIRKNTRALAIAYLIGTALIFRNGYLPFPLIIMILPFAAVNLAAALDWALKNLQMKSFVRLSLAQGVILTIVAATVFGAGPQWLQKYYSFMTVDYDYSSRQTVAWVKDNVDNQSRLVVESALWSDLENGGFDQPEPVWLYKTETDPSIIEEIQTWQSVDYVILNAITVDAATFPQSFPTVSEAIDNSDLMQSYGTDFQEVRIYKVRNN